MVPLAMISYSRADDEHDGGNIRTLANMIRNEVRLSSSHSFDIFIDQNDILWGQQWRHRIDAGLEASTLLIPFITPEFFRSNECRREFLQFSTHETSRGRDDLILSIMYRNVDLKQLAAKTDEAATIATEVAKRQYLNWASIRHDDPSSAKVRKQVSDAAEKIVAALDRTAERSLRDSSYTNHAQPALGSSQEWIIDQNSSHHIQSVQEAISRARHGDRLVICGEVSANNVHIERAIEIRGHGPHPTLRLAGGSLIVETTTAGLEGIRLQSSESASPLVRVTKGRLSIKDCHLNGVADVGLVVCSGAESRVVKSTISGFDQYGAVCAADGSLTLLESEISKNCVAGIVGEMGSCVIAKDCRITRNGHGAFLYFHGDWDLNQDQFLDNAYGDISRNTLARQ